MNTLIVLLTINHAKSKISKHTESPLGLSGITITRNFHLGINFKENNNYSLWEYVYTIPEGAVYTRPNGSDLLIRSDVGK